MTTETPEFIRREEVGFFDNFHAIRFSMRIFSVIVFVKCYQYRIYPTKSQEKILEKYIDVCRKTYNKCLEYKKSAYEKDKTNISEFDLNKKICDWRNGEEDWMKDCGIAILHDVSRRLNKSFGGFFRRVQRGEKAGYPRFKAENRYNGFTVPRFTYKEKKNNRYHKIRLTNDIGWMKIKKHRNFLGNAKGYTIVKNRCGEWFVSILIEKEEIHKRPLDKSRNIGIDLGCTNIMTLSNGEIIDAPKYLKKKQKDLAKAQKKKNKKAVAKIHKKITNQRKDFAHKLTNRIVNDYDIIITEKINIEKLKEKTYKNVRKSLGDNSWNQLTTFLSYKAEDAGKVFKMVNPAYTSQKCSNCGKIHKLKLSDRQMSCGCGYSEDRDVNAARNILTVGLHGLEKS